MDVFVCVSRCGCFEHVNKLSGSIKFRNSLFCSISQRRLSYMTLIFRQFLVELYTPRQRQIRCCLHLRILKCGDIRQGADEINAVVTTQ
jgi:hypothetical protein